MNNETKQVDLSEYEEEAEPFDDVMQKLLQAKPRPKEGEKPEKKLQAKPAPK